MLGETVEDIIKNTVNDVLSLRKIPDLKDQVYTDSMGEVIEKLCILHIRMWMIEDQLGLAKTDEEIASLKKKTDICFKIKRPKLVAAVNQMFNDALLNNKNLVEDSVKQYKGVDS
jgi:hypothetical protein